MDKSYGGVIWTNHALQRLTERGISQGDAWATWKRPDQSRFATAKGAWVYYRTYKTERFGGGSVGEKIEVVAKKGNRGEWLILSVWSKPVYGKSELSEPGNKKKFLGSFEIYSYRPIRVLS